PVYKRQFFRAALSAKIGGQFQGNEVLPPVGDPNITEEELHRNFTAEQLQRGFDALHFLSSALVNSSDQAILDKHSTAKA
ncbi:unnamed protein product, partial [Pylaiella littoralis]